MRPKKLVLVYSADGERAALVAYALEVALRECRTQVVARAAGLQTAVQVAQDAEEQATGSPMGCVLVLRSARETGRDREALAALPCGGHAVVIEALYGMPAVCRHAGVYLPGPVEVLRLREAVRMACMRKRGPKRKTEPRRPRMPQAVAVVEEGMVAA